jgi:tetratricopeptide (TPR) repeat protein
LEENEEYVCANKRKLALVLAGKAYLHSIWPSSYEYVDAAKQEFDEALAILRSILRNDEDYLALAEVLQAKAPFLERFWLLDDAEGCRLEAYAILKRLDSKATGCCDYELAKCLEGISNLHMQDRQLEEAEAERLEALKLLRRLAENNPISFEPDISGCLIGLASIHSDMNEGIKKAEDELLDAFDRVVRLFCQNPKEYGVILSSVMMRLGNLHETGVSNELGKGEIKCAQAIRAIADDLSDSNAWQLLHDVNPVLCTRISLGVKK